MAKKNGSTDNLKYMEIYNHFRGLIKSGVLKPGDKLPTEEQIGKNFDVSRITVIYGLNQLQKEKLIYRVQGSGSFVSEEPGATSDKINIISLIVSFKGEGREIQLIEGIENHLKQNGYLLTVSNSGEDIDEERKLIENIKNKVKGIILYPASSNANTKIFDDLLKEQYPIVYIDRYPVSVPCSYVVSDNFDGGYKIGKFFTEKGHERIALIYHDITEFTSERDRFNGFMKAMSEGMIPKEYINIISIKRSETEDTLEKIIKELYIKKPASEIPTAIFTFNDHLANSIMDYIHKKKIRLPENFVLAGFDDLENKPRHIPFITIRQMHYQMGEEAAKLALKKIRNNSFVNEQQIIPVELVQAKLL